MSTRFRLLLICSTTVSIINACVTTHRGEERKVEGADVTISCSESPQYRTDYHTAVTCNFENNGDKWQTFEVASVKPEAGATVLSGEETCVFAKAFAFKTQKDDHNFNLAVGTIMLAGLAVGLGSSDTQTAGLGGGAALGASSVAIGRPILKAYQNATYGEEHLLGGPFSVPPGSLFLRKSAILQFSSTKTIPKSIEICLKQPKEQCFTYPLVTEYAHNRLAPR